jgi:hypothetical protein
MLVEKGTFIFNCKHKGGIPMTLERCLGRCKMINDCKLYNQMKKMSNKLEKELREEKIYNYQYDM